MITRLPNSSAAFALVTNCAAEEFVRDYELLIRREVRLLLHDPRLTRLLDSVDLSQSVLASFFWRSAAGQYQLDGPQQLARLLLTMARNKMASQARREHRQCRDVRRDELRDDMIDRVADDELSPSDRVCREELLERIRDGMNAEELRIAELRSSGMAWAEIADQLGGTAQGRRMQLARATDRLSRELNSE